MVDILTDTRPPNEENQLYKYQYLSGKILGDEKITPEYVLTSKMILDKVLAWLSSSGEPSIVASTNMKDTIANLLHCDYDNV